MAHNINTYIGRESAWHALGTVTGRYMTWAEILAHGGLDFSVFKSQLHDGKGNLVDAWGMFRWDKATDPDADNTTYLGTVGEGYTPIHHSKGFEMLDHIVRSANEAHYETAGVLGKGEIVWGLINLNMTIHVGDDMSIPRLLFATSYDGSMAHTYRNCVERVVCNNTLNVALSEKGRSQFRVKHTKFAKDRLTEAHKALDAISADVRTVEAKLNFLAQRKVTKESYQSIMDRLFPPTKAEDGEVKESTRRENILGDILGLYESCDKNAFPEQRGTAYNLLNAITEYTDHERSTRNGGRAESAVFGSGDQLKSKALELITESAANMPGMSRSVVYSTAPSKPPKSESEAIMAELLGIG